MGKVILEFDSIEESVEARTAIDGTKWKISMWDLDQELRATIKYGSSVFSSSEPAKEEEIKIAEKYREKIREILEGHGLSLID